MKQAVGEANKTLISMVLISVIASFGIVVVPKIMEKFTNHECCVENGGVLVNNECYDSSFCQIDGSGNTTCSPDGRISWTCKQEGEKCYAIYASFSQKKIVSEKYLVNCDTGEKIRKVD